MPECRMPTSNAVPQAASDSAMDALYRAALGPVQLPRYLALFERFDRAGRAPAGWNFAAGLATLNWMLLHHLWSAALVYVALVEGLALLVFGVGRPLLHWPEQIEWGLFAAFAMFAIVLPGVFGDALLHREIRKRTAHALVAAHTMPEAHLLLARQASSWRRLGWIAAANVLLFAAIGLTWALVPAGSASAPGTAAGHIATGAVQAAAPVLAPAPKASEVAGPTVPAALPPTPSAVDAVVTHETPGIASTGKALAPPPPPLLAQHNAQVPAAPPRPPASTQAAPALPLKALSSPIDPTSSGPAPVDPAPPGPAPVHPAPAAPHAKAAETPSLHTAGKRKTQTSAASAKPTTQPAAAPAATRPSAAAPEPPVSAASPVGSAPGYYLNIGLFAEEANARRAQAKLLNANLPAFRQTFATKNGERTRVRVGPFATPAEAQKAATHIRSMQLDAVMYRQHG